MNIDHEVVATWHDRIDRICRAVAQAEQAQRIRPTSARLILDQLQLAQERVKTLELHSANWLTDPLKSARILTDGVPDIEQAIVSAICRAERKPEIVITKPKPRKEPAPKPYTGPSDTQCVYPGCTRRPHARGYCNAHYTKLRADGTLQVNRISRAWCTVQGCENVAYAKGWCKYHHKLHGVAGKWGQRKTWAQVCSVDGCERKAGATGLCEKHLHRKHRRGTPDAPRPLKDKGKYVEPPKSDVQRECIVEGCGRRAVAQFLCMRHYKQRRRKHQHAENSQSDGTP